jgi:hypothetical protein
MAEPHVVTALVRKRAEVAGEIEAAGQRLDALRQTLAHVDAVLRLYAPERIPCHIPAKRLRPKSDWAKRGEMKRRILDTLRSAGEPLCAREIALRIMAARGLDAGDVRARRRMVRRVGTALRRQDEWLLAAVASTDVVEIRCSLAVGDAPPAVG